MKTFIHWSISPYRVILWLLLLTSLATQAQLKVDYGKSFVNITKGTSGGTIEPGDTLEIRATFVVKGTGTNDYADSCAFFDVIPSNTSYIPGSLAVLTNEGKVYKTFTDVAGDDPGWISGSNVRINLGFKNAPTATATRRGRIKFNDKPTFFGSSCIMVASYRVKVTGGYNSKINIGGGSVSYLPFGGSLTAVNFQNDTIMIFFNYGICNNTGGGNAILSESGGTFGAGTAKNRGASTKVPSNYTYATFTGGMPNDYYYGISNNTSTNGVGYTTSNAWPIPDANLVPAPGPAQSHRVFNVWDIIGDHTGAASPTLGNPPTDTVNGSGGYMVVINASYKTDTAFLDTVTNLCPNTYYQYYAWFRNICSRCACDSNGKAPGNTGYIPTGTNDSSGVHPNMTFSINGYDYYTTGNILYSGQWVKKGFTYLTGPTQTSMIINIRNNAPGGGGNDWAIDDIGVATCAPNIALTPNKPDTLCMGADDTVRFKVSAFFNNYTEWKLEKSIDGGLTWSSPGTDTTGKAPNGSAVPVYNGVTGQYEYIVTRYYRLNNTDPTIIYRLTIATTTGNLSNPNCANITSTPKIIRAINCMILLPTSVTLKAQMKNGKPVLQWSSSDETPTTKFAVERKDENGNFEQIAIIDGKAESGTGAFYTFTDAKPVAGNVYYRIRIVDGSYQKYSNMAMVSSNAIGFAIQSLINPFVDHLSFDITVPQDGTISYTLFDMYGRIVRRDTQKVNAGLNNIQINNLNNIADAAYSLRLQFADQSLIKQVIKSGNH